MGAVDGDFVGDVPGGGQAGEEPVPDALGAPPIVAVIEGGGWAVLGRAVAPAAAGAQDVQDATDHPAIVDAGRARAAFRQMRFDYRPASSLNHSAPLRSCRPPGKHAANHKTVLINGLIRLST
jgi:hypothetical protein